LVGWLDFWIYSTHDAVIAGITGFFAEDYGSNNLLLTGCNRRRVEGSGASFKKN
jgi:hypothetical protein